MGLIAHARQSDGAAKTNGVPGKAMPAILKQAKAYVDKVKATAARKAQLIHGQKSR